ncbi:diacylglycerol/lipid kinase family protein [Desertihabitans aurantiacus]|uniref:diacylglycerol/lipid kinase family protein n=1 Tax=Desertihabitans aurantiacus TaxID=2282477 RepID=UPI000DF834D7|nr:diacylglycerol kinase family protein [Desertihabitans aurantiacus]
MTRSDEPGPEPAKPRTSADPDSSTSPEHAASATAEQVREADTREENPPPRAAVVYNPTKVDLEVLRATVDAAAEEASWGETSWIETTADDPGESMARQAVEQGVDMVIAAGGDGTVRAVTQGLIGSDVALGLLPSGTGNLLARNLDLELKDLTQAVSTAFAGEDRSIDVGMARIRRKDGTEEELAFVVLAGLGLDAQMIEHTDEELKKKIGWLAYARAIANALRGGNRIRMRIGVDAEPQRTRNMHTLLIGNCGNLPGNIVLLPEATLDDGLLDIVALRPDGFFGWLQIWAKVVVENYVLNRTEVGRRLQGAQKSVRALRYLTGKKVIVALRHPEPFELDGDSYGEVTAFQIEVVPRSLRVRVRPTD